MAYKTGTWGIQAKLRYKKRQAVLTEKDIVRRRKLAKLRRLRRYAFYKSQARKYYQKKKADISARRKQKYLSLKKIGYRRCCWGGSGLRISTLIVKKLFKLRKIRCAHCHKLPNHPSGEGLLVHHRDENKSNNTLKNLIILCKLCHIKTHIKLGTYKRSRHAKLVG